jgi:hypothetical protein
MKILMRTYMVERDLRGVTMDQLAAAQRAAIDTSKQVTGEGQQVRYLRSTFVPGDARCMCLFEAASPEAVREVNDRAKIPYTKIVEAFDLTP